jgi:hypothetical protein
MRSLANLVETSCTRIQSSRIGLILEYQVAAIHERLIRVTSEGGGATPCAHRRSHEVTATAPRESVLWRAEDSNRLAIVATVGPKIRSVDGDEGCFGSSLLIRTRHKSARSGFRSE